MKSKIMHNMMLYIFYLLSLVRNDRVNRLGYSLEYRNCCINPNTSIKTILKWLVK